MTEAPSGAGSANPLRAYVITHTVSDRSRIALLSVFYVVFCEFVCQFIVLSFFTKYIALYILCLFCYPTLITLMYLRGCLLKRLYLLDVDAWFS